MGRTLALGQENLAGYFSFKLPASSVESPSTGLEGTTPAKNSHFFFLFFTKLNKKGDCVYLYFHGVKSEPWLILEANQVRGKRKRRQPKKMKLCLEGQQEAMGRDLREALN